MQLKDDEGVGYKRPPKAHQFRPGESGNPSGRPKIAVSFRSELRQELSEAVTFGSEPSPITKVRAVVKTLVAAAIAGDSRAIATILSVGMRALGENEAADESNSAEDAEIVKAVQGSPVQAHGGPSKSS